MRICTIEYDDERYKEYRVAGFYSYPALEAELGPFLAAPVNANPRDVGA